jgi:hypothetical protein
MDGECARAELRLHVDDEEVTTSLPLLNRVAEKRTPERAPWEQETKSGCANHGAAVRVLKFEGFVFRCRVRPRG